jgi:hypothetical protein
MISISNCFNADYLQISIRQVAQHRVQDASPSESFRLIYRSGRQKDRRSHSQVVRVLLMTPKTAVMPEPYMTFDPLTPKRREPSLG